MAELKKYSLDLNRDQFITVMDALKRYSSVDKNVRDAIVIMNDAMHDARVASRAAAKMVAINEQIKNVPESVKMR